jgi:hypothetical protein
MSDHQPAANDEVRRGLARCHGGSGCECVSDAETEIRTSTTPSGTRSGSSDGDRSVDFADDRGIYDDATSEVQNRLDDTPFSLGFYVPARKPDPSDDANDMSPMLPVLRSQLMLDLTISGSIWPKFPHLFHGFGFLVCSAFGQNFYICPMFVYI